MNIQSLLNAWSAILFFASPSIAQAQSISLAITSPTQSTISTGPYTVLEGTVSNTPGIDLYVPGGTICLNEGKFFANNVPYLPSSPYYFTDLQTTEGRNSTARGIDSVGTVVGDVDFQPVSWSSNGSPSALTKFGGSAGTAYTISPVGHIAGFSYTAGNASQQGSLWLARLPPVPPQVLDGIGYQNSVGFAINSSGHVVGEVYNADQVVRPATWKGSTGTLLPTLGGTAGAAAAINDSGTAVGYSNPKNNKSYHATVWYDSSATNFGVPLGGTNSYAFALNNRGLIVGRSDLPSNASYHAVLWTSKNNYVDLGTLGGANSSANSINNTNQIVGRSNTASGEEHATLWVGSKIVDLNSAAINLDGWVLRRARGINDQGWIIGDAEKAENGQIATHGFLLRPTSLISLLATAADGSQSTATVNMAPPSRLTGIRIEGPQCGGSAPYAATYRLQSSPGLAINSITKLEADLDGDGSIDYSSTDPSAAIDFNYLTPGLYKANFVATDASGIKYSTERLTLVSLNTRTAPELFSILASLKSDLDANNISNALSRFTPRLREELEGPLSKNKTITKRISAMLAGAPKVEHLGDQIAELSITTVKDNVATVHRITFMRDNFGAWKINGL